MVLFGQIVIGPPGAGTLYCDAIDLIYCSVALLYDNYVLIVALFAHLIIGKTTFCHGMKMYMEAIGRSCAIINLDFANDILPYIPAVDVRELMALEVSFSNTY